MKVARFRIIAIANADRGQGCLVQSNCICSWDRIAFPASSPIHGSLFVTMKSLTARPRTDVAGIACSVGCAIHCAAVPVLASMAPTIGTGWMAGSIVHQLVALICCVLVVRAILPAWRQHRDNLVAVAAGLGLTLLMLAAFVLPDPCCEPTKVMGWLGVPILGVNDLNVLFGSSIAAKVLSLQPYITPAGGLLLIVAHLINFDLGRRLERARVAVCLPSSSKSSCC